MGAIQQGVSNGISTIAVLGAGGKKLAEDAAQSKELKATKKLAEAEAQRRELENRAAVSEGILNEKEGILEEAKNTFEDTPLTDEEEILKSYIHPSSGFGDNKAALDETNEVLAYNRAQKRIEALERDPAFKIRQQYANGEIDSYAKFQELYNKSKLDTYNKKMADELSKIKKLDNAKSDINEDGEEAMDLWKEEGK